MSLRLASIRRYPVKSMGGEPLTSVVANARGLVGDRWFAVQDAEGHFASGKNTRRFRRRDEVFDYAASTENSGVVVRGAEGAWDVGDPALDASLSNRMGLPVRVLPERDVPHYDDGSVSLIGTATLDWFEARGIGADPRRLRVNLVVETSEPFVEETWIGHQIEIGEAAFDVVQRVERCRMIDLDQDGVVAEGHWLKALPERDMCAAVYADVAREGVIAVGDRVTVR